MGESRRTFCFFFISASDVEERTSPRKMDLPRLLLPVHGTPKKPYVVIPNNMCPTCFRVKQFKGPLKVPELEDHWWFCGQCGIVLKPFEYKMSSKGYLHVYYRCPKQAPSTCNCQLWGAYL